MDRVKDYAKFEAAVWMSKTEDESSPAFVEAVECLESTESRKGEKFKEALINGIIKDYSKVASKNPEITASKGSFSKFKGSDTITKCIKALYTEPFPVVHAKNGKRVDPSDPKKLPEYDINLLADINKLRKQVLVCTPYYVQAYASGNKIIQCEYECNVFILSTIPSAIIAKNMSALEYSSREKTAFTKIRQYIRSVCSAEHTEMLKSVLFDNRNQAKPVSESTDLARMDTYNESLVGTAMLIAAAVVSLLIGIRFITWMIFKVRTNVSDALEVQKEYLEANVKRLKNRRDIDPEKKDKIIGKQMKWIDALGHYAEKFRVKFNVNVPESAPLPDKPKEDTKPDTSSKDDDDGFLI
jgi:hypothetical protein